MFCVNFFLHFSFEVGLIADDGFWNELLYLKDLKSNMQKLSMFIKDQFTWEQREWKCLVFGE